MGAASFVFVSFIQMFWFLTEVSLFLLQMMNAKDMPDLMYANYAPFLIYELIIMRFIFKASVWIENQTI